MPLLRSRKAHTTTTAPRSGGFFSRRRQPATTRHTHHGLTGPTTTTTTTRKTRRGFFSRRPRTQQRKPSMGDKISGAMLKLKGALTGRPGQKAAGTRRMHGTDGRGSRRTRW